MLKFQELAASTSPSWRMGGARPACASSKCWRSASRFPFLSCWATSSKRSVKPPSANLPARARHVSDGLRQLTDRFLHVPADLALQLSMVQPGLDLCATTNGRQAGSNSRSAESSATSLPGASCAGGLMERSCLRGHLRLRGNRARLHGRCLRRAGVSRRRITLPVSGSRNTIAV